MARRPDTHPGQYYVRHRDGRLAQATPDDVAAHGDPDMRVCRRIADFPEGRVPPGGATATCRACAAPVVYNPAGPYQNRPTVCMQCAGLRPLPIT